MVCLPARVRASFVAWPEPCSEGNGKTGPDRAVVRFLRARKGRGGRREGLKKSVHEIASDRGLVGKRRNQREPWSARLRDRRRDDVERQQHGAGEGAENGGGSSHTLHRPPPSLLGAPSTTPHSQLLHPPPSSSQQEAVDVGVFSWPPLTLSVGVGLCRISQLAQARLNEITTTVNQRRESRHGAAVFRIPSMDSMAPYLRPFFFLASQLRLPASRLLLLGSLPPPSSFRLGAIVTSQRRQRRDEARGVVAVAETRTCWRVLDNGHGMSTAVLHTAQPATREVPLKREGDTKRGTFVLI